MLLGFLSLTADPPQVVVCRSGDNGDHTYRQQEVLAGSELTRRLLSDGQERGTRCPK